jgi:hypothetical protein
MVAQDDQLMLLIRGVGAGLLDEVEIEFRHILRLVDDEYIGCDRIGRSGR